jgi:hypothetical protein
MGGAAVSASWCTRCGRYHWIGACADLDPGDRLIARIYIALLAAQVREFGRLLRDAAAEQRREVQR